MKFKHQISIYAGSIGMTTLIAILLSVREQLVTVGPWVLDALLACAGSMVIYGGFRVFIAGRQHWLSTQAQAQTLRIESERWQVERSALLLAQHLQTARIYPDGKGYLPTIVQLTPDGYQQFLSLPHATRPVQQSQQTQLPEQAESLIPTSVRYEDIKAMIPAGHGLMGVSATGVDTAEFHQFMTMLISGGSNSGKSNTVSLKIDEAIRNGRDIRLLVIDWHARKPDSLYNKIKCYEDRFLMPVVKDEEETLPALQWFYTEFKRRLTSEQRSNSEPDILLVVDEVPGMMDAEDEEIPKMLRLIARKCGREARGFGMYGWFIAQQMIGLAWLRNIVHTVIAHKATRINEAIICCNDHKDIARDMENWPQGRVIVYGQNFQGVKVLQMPIFTPPVIVDADAEMEPLQQPLPNSSIIDFQTQQWKRNGNNPESTREAVGSDIELSAEEKALMLKNLLGELREKRANGTPLNAILREYGIKPGRVNRELQQLLDEIAE